MAKAKKGKSTNTANDGLSNALEAASDRTIHIDPDGDLDIVVGLEDEAKTFHVSSKVMCLTSKAWRAMLSHGFKETNSGADPVTFPEDDTYAFFIILLASHLKFHLLPSSIDFKQLFHLCVLGDKYDCIHVLRPWLTGWISPWTDHVTHEGYEKWAFVSWAVGDEGNFKSITEQLLLKCKTNDSKQCLNSSGAVLDDKLPPGLPKCLLETRYAVLTELVETCQSMVIKYGYSGDQFLCKASVNREECDSLCYGHMIKYFQKLDLWPGNPQDIAERMKSTNMETLWTELKKINSPKLPNDRDRYDYDYGHDSCRWSSSFHAELAKVVTGRGSKVMEAHRRHFEQLRQKLESSKVGILDELHIFEGLLEL